MPKRKSPSDEMPPKLQDLLQRMFLNIVPVPFTPQSIAAELADLPRGPERWLVATEPLDLDGEKLLLSLVLAPTAQSRCF